MQLRGIKKWIVALSDSLKFQINIKSIENYLYFREECYIIYLLIKVFNANFLPPHP